MYIYIYIALELADLCGQEERVAALRGQRAGHAVALGARVEVDVADAYIIIIFMFM